MANLLKMAVSETIRTLHRRGWSQRRIADELGINRETVARHLRQADRRLQDSARRAAQLGAAAEARQDSPLAPTRLETRSAAPRQWPGQRL